VTANEQLAERAKALRLQAGLTQLQVVERAVAAGFPTLSGPTFSNLENGKRGWNARYIDAVSAGLGLSPAAFLASTQAPAGGVRQRLALAVEAAVDLLLEAARPSQVG
jgi:transcriptional regulator with XRE-family HTH domain